MPAWIACGHGALSDEQKHWLRAHAADHLPQLDVLPTVLDLYGLLDAFPLLERRKTLVGRSLLRPFTAPPAVLPISNCTALSPCLARTSGVLKEGPALLAQPWDEDWRCMRLAAANRPLVLASDPACLALREASKAILPELPNGKPNR